jgi:hypothetical protein
MNTQYCILVLCNVATLAMCNPVSENNRNKAVEEPLMKRWGKPEETAKVAECIAHDTFFRDR